MSEEVQLEREVRMRVAQHAVVACLFLFIASVTTADQGSLRSGPNAPTWNDVCSLAVGNNDVQWAVGDSGKVLNLVNGDTNTEHNLGEGLYDLQGVAFADANHGWIVGYKRDDPERLRGVVFRTTTGGDNPQEWTATFPVIRPGIDAPFLKVQAVSSQRVWLTCNGGYILRSNDGGVNWLATAKRDGVEYGGKPGTQGRDHEK
jgi:photosystem II stability/assembly factor-like uncharacterized protein